MGPFTIILAAVNLFCIEAAIAKALGQDQTDGDDDRDGGGNDLACVV